MWICWSKKKILYKGHSQWSIDLFIPNCWDKNKNNLNSTILFLLVMWSGIYYYLSSWILLWTTKKKFRPEFFFHIEKQKKEQQWKKLLFHFLICSIVISYIEYRCVCEECVFDNIVVLSMNKTKNKTKQYGPRVFSFYNTKRQFIICWRKNKRHSVKKNEILIIGEKSEKKYITYSDQTQMSKVPRKKNEKKIKMNESNRIESIVVEQFVFFVYFTIFIIPTLSSLTTTTTTTKNGNKEQKRKIRIRIDVCIK